MSLPASPAVSVIVPVFDEVDNVQPLHAAICAALLQYDFEVVYVDDGSTDGTAAALDALASEDEKIRIIHFVRNYGQTAALTAGIRHATAPILVTMDADLQNDPADIPAMLDRLSEYNIMYN